MNKREYVELVYKCRRIFEHAKYHNLIIVKSECEICGSNKNVIGHHHDYSLPLDVQWLCKSCHALYHQIYGSAQAGSLPRATRAILQTYVEKAVEKQIVKGV